MLSFKNFIQRRTLSEGIYWDWTYSVPHDKEQQMFDFYELSFLEILENANNDSPLFKKEIMKTYPKPKAEEPPLWKGKTGDWFDDKEEEEEPEYGGLDTGDVGKLRWAILDVKEKLFPYLLNNLKQSIFYAICCEMTHCITSANNEKIYNELVLGQQSGYFGKRGQAPNPKTGKYEDQHPAFRTRGHPKNHVELAQCYAEYIAQMEAMGFVHLKNDEDDATPSGSAKPYASKFIKNLPMRSPKYQKRYGIDPKSDAYKQSYKAALYACHDDLRLFARTAEYCFEYAHWSPMYGGYAWWRIARGLLELEDAQDVWKKFEDFREKYFAGNSGSMEPLDGLTDKQSHSVSQRNIDRKAEAEKFWEQEKTALGALHDAIDHCYDLQHNTNVVFDKVNNWKKNGSHGWIKPALNLKAQDDIKEPFDLYHKCSSSMQELIRTVSKKFFGKDLQSYIENLPGKKLPDSGYDDPHSSSYIKPLEHKLRKHYAMFKVNFVDSENPDEKESDEPLWNKIDTAIITIPKKAEPWENEHWRGDFTWSIPVAELDGLVKKGQGTLFGIIQNKFPQLSMPTMKSLARFMDEKVKSLWNRAQLLSGHKIHALAKKAKPVTSAPEPPDMPDDPDAIASEPDEDMDSATNLMLPGPYVIQTESGEQTIDQHEAHHISAYYWDSKGKSGDEAVTEGMCRAYMHMGCTQQQTLAFMKKYLDPNKQAGKDVAKYKMDEPSFWELVNEKVMSRIGEADKYATLKAKIDAQSSSDKKIQVCKSVEGSNPCSDSYAKLIYKTMMAIQYCTASPGDGDEITHQNGIHGEALTFFVPKKFKPVQFLNSSANFSLLNDDIKKYAALAANNQIPDATVLLRNAYPFMTLNAATALINYIKQKFPASPEDAKKAKEEDEQKKLGNDIQHVIKAYPEGYTVEFMLPPGLKAIDGISEEAVKVALPCKIIKEAHASTYPVAKIRDYLGSVSGAGNAYITIQAGITLWAYIQYHWYSEFKDAVDKELPANNGVEIKCLGLSDDKKVVNFHIPAAKKWDNKSISTSLAIPIEKVKLVLSKLSVPAQITVLKHLGKYTPQATLQLLLICIKNKWPEIQQQLSGSSSASGTLSGEHFTISHTTNPSGGTKFEIKDKSGNVQQAYHALSTVKTLAKDNLEELVHNFQTKSGFAAGPAKALAEYIKTNFGAYDGTAPAGAVPGYHIMHNEIEDDNSTVQVKFIIKDVDESGKLEQTTYTFTLDSVKAVSKEQSHNATEELISWGVDEDIATQLAMYIKERWGKTEEGDYQPVDKITHQINSDNNVFFFIDNKHEHTTRKFPWEYVAEIIKMVGAGKTPTGGKIEAIKKVMNDAKIGLYTSKQLVEYIMEKWPTTSPDEGDEIKHKEEADGVTFDIPKSMFPLGTGTPTGLELECTWGQMKAAMDVGNQPWGGYDLLKNAYPGFQGPAVKQLYLYINSHWSEWSKKASKAQNKATSTSLIYHKISADKKAVEFTVPGIGMPTMTIGAVQGIATHGSNVLLVNYLNNSGYDVDDEDTDVLYQYILKHWEKDFKPLISGGTPAPQQSKPSAAKPGTPEGLLPGYPVIHDPAKTGIAVQVQADRYRFFFPANLVAANVPKPAMLKQVTVNSIRRLVGKSKLHDAFQRLEIPGKHLKKPVALDAWIKFIAAVKPENPGLYFIDGKPVGG